MTAPTLTEILDALPPADGPEYLVIGDIHLSERAPSSCTEDYLDDLFAILEHTVEIAERRNVAGVIWSGDIFHHKQPSKNSHRLVLRAVDLIRKYRKLWIVPGNHDMLNDRFDSINDTQPLGVLFEAGAELLNGWERTGQHPIYGVPWNQVWSEETVSDALADWRRERTPDEPQWNAQRLVVAHAPLYPPGQEVVYEYYPTRDEEPTTDETGADVPGRRGWATLMGNVGSCYYGHVHDAHLDYEVQGVSFCNQGAITRGSLHESDLNRKIAVTLWSPSTGFTRVDVPHKPADQVFRLMEIREVEDKQVQLDEFLASVGQTTVEITSIEAVTALIQGREDLPANVRATAVQLLQEVDH